MRNFRYFGLIAILLVLTVSCANRTKTASNNPYQSNPYYTNTGSSTASSPEVGGSSYSAPSYKAPSTPPASYPSYTGGTYSEPSNTGPNTYDNSIPPIAPYSPSTPSYNPSTPSYSPGLPASGATHVVASGENLYRISLKYGTTVSAIQSANGLTSNTIHPGQVLRIP